MALATSLQSSIPGLQQFTALNDSYHAGTGSAHARGLALDFTLGDPKKSAETAAAIRAQLGAMGVNAQVLDEYLNPSARSTGGHIHVGFRSMEDAQRYYDRSNGGGTVSTSSITIGEINVHTQATDAPGIAASIGPAIRQGALASLGNSGPQ